MNRVVTICLRVALSLVTLVSFARADEFKLSNNQRISCSRGLAAGKLNTATCKSYAYLFNIKTSEYFRCQVSLSLTRDNKEVINVQTDGSCTKKPRIFENDSNYDFDATETEPPTLIRSSAPAAIRSGSPTRHSKRYAAASRFHQVSAPTFPNAWT